MCGVYESNPCIHMKDEKYTMHKAGRCVHHYEISMILDFNPLKHLDVSLIKKISDLVWTDSSKRSSQT